MSMSAPMPAYMFKRPWWSRYTETVAEKAVQDIARTNRVSRLAAIRFLQDYLDFMEREAIAAGEE